MNNLFYINNNQEFENKLSLIINEFDVKKVFLVCGKSFEKQEYSFPFYEFLNKNKICLTKFSEFESNPKIEDVIKGVHIFNEDDYNLIIVSGGGSSIDVAKCIKLFSDEKNLKNYKNREKYINVNIPLLVIPTSAGSGSESTQFAVVYENNIKLSIDTKYILPNYVFLIPYSLKNLSLYQKKATLLDAFCQAFESYWSISSNDESKKYSSIAIKLLLKNDNYLKYLLYYDFNIYNDIILASNYAGKAINITRTTAPHAMSYKLTELYSIPHGIAVALSFIQVLNFTINNIDKCIDYRGKQYFLNVLNELCVLFNVDNNNDLFNKIYDIIYNKFEIRNPTTNNFNEHINILVNSVNIERLSNNPIEIKKNNLQEFYKNILRS